MKAKLFLFLFGALIGFLVAVLFRPLFQPMVAEILRDEADRAEGRVVGKRLQDKRLLLTVNAAEGTILATFGKKVEEIDMLVEEGDLVTLGVPRYQPFVEDPPVLAVRKREASAVGAGAEAPEEARDARDAGDEPERPPGGILPGRTEPPGTEPGEGEAEAEEEEPPPADPGLAEGEAEPEDEPPPAA